MLAALVVSCSRPCRSFRPARGQPAAPTTVSLETWRDRLGRQRALAFGLSLFQLHSCPRRCKRSPKNGPAGRRRPIQPASMVPGSTRASQWSPLSGALAYVGRRICGRQEVLLFFFLFSFGFLLLSLPLSFYHLISFSPYFCPFPLFLSFLSLPSPGPRPRCCPHSTASILPCSPCCPGMRASDVFFPLCLSELISRRLGALFPTSAPALPRYCSCRAGSASQPPPGRSNRQASWLALTSRVFSW